MFLIPDDDRIHPVKVYSGLLALPEHTHLAEHRPDVAFLMREGTWNRQGRRVLGMCCMPGVTGTLSPLFDWMLERTIGYWPVFLFILSAEFWLEASDRQREILMFHEMMHAGQATDEYGGPKFNRQGEPVWCIRGHDVEEFNAVVARYGAWKTDLKLFADALGVGAELSEGAEA